MEDLTKTTINQELFKWKVKQYTKSGLTKITLFQDDPDFNEFSESGMMKFLLETYEHETRCGGDCFVFFLDKKIKI